MEDYGQIDRIFTLGDFNGTFNVESKQGIKAFSIAGLEATNATVTGNVTSLGGVTSTPIVINNTKAPLTISALSNGSYLDGIVIDCTAGKADVVFVI